jgi:hypothetical protein
MSSEVYQRRICQLVPMVMQIHYFVEGIREASCGKYTTVLSAVVLRYWSKINYYLSLAFGPSRHSDVIASHFSFNPSTLTRYQKYLIRKWRLISV